MSSLASGSDPYGVPGIDAIVEYNGLELNNKTTTSSTAECYWVNEIGGLDDADIRDSRELKPQAHGEISYDAWYGGRTITITGYIRAYNLAKMRSMIFDLKQAFSTLEELPLYLRQTVFDSDGSQGDMFINCRKSASISIKESQGNQKFWREFLVTLRASDPRFYSAEEFYEDIIVTNAEDSQVRIYQKEYDKEYLYYVEDTLATPNYMPTLDSYEDLVERTGSINNELDVVDNLSGLYWNLQESSGTVASDNSGNSRNGTYQASPMLGEDGPWDQATGVSLNGSTQYISSSYNPFVNSRTNLIANPKAATTLNPSGSAGDWALDSCTPARVTFSTSTTPPEIVGLQTGVNVPDVNANNDSVRVVGDVVNGQTYTVSFYIYIASMTGTSAQIGILVQNSSFATISGGTGTIGAGGATATTGEWIRLYHTFTAAANDTYLFKAIYTGSGTTAANFYITGVLLETGSTLDSYFDGDSAGSRWTGTYNVSTSVQPRARTYMGWAYRNTNATADTLFGSSSSTVGPHLRCTSGADTAAFSASITAGYNTFSSAVIPTAEWFHWALTFDESTNTAELFINGLSQGTVTETDVFNAAPGNFQVGMAGSSTDPFDGSMSQVTVYERMLSAQEIYEHYYSGYYTSSIAIINNEGNFESDPIIRFYGKLIDPVIHNTTTGDTVSLIGTVEAGGYIEYDIKNGTLIDQSGNNRFGMLDPSSDIPNLDVGENAWVANSTNLTGAPYVRIFYRHAHL